MFCGSVAASLFNMSAAAFIASGALFSAFGFNAPAVCAGATPELVGVCLDYRDLLQNYFISSLRA
jgi:hypothetical protein